jgi:hypothetical protein
MALSEAKWYVQFPDKISGPFSIEQLQKLVTSGRVSPHDRVSENKTTWMPIESLPDVTFHESPVQSTASEREVSVLCECGKTFAVLRAYAGMQRPCPRCNTTCLVPTLPNMSAEIVRHTGARRYDSADDLPTVFRVVVAAGLAWAIGSLIIAALAALAGAHQMAALIAVTGIVKAIVFAALQLGLRWSWYGSQLLAVLELIGVAGMYAQMPSAPWYAGLIPIVIYGPLLIVLYMPSVREHLR